MGRAVIVSVLEETFQKEALEQGHRGKQRDEGLETPPEYKSQRFSMRSPRKGTITKIDRHEPQIKVPNQKGYDN